MSSMSGTTRDAIDTDVAGPDGRTFKLIDTAGIRRRTAVAGAVTESPHLTTSIPYFLPAAYDCDIWSLSRAGSPDGAEPLSVERAFRAIRRSDAVALVIDAVDGITQQDFRCRLAAACIAASAVH